MLMKMKKKLDELEKIGLYLNDCLMSKKSSK